MDVIVVVDGEFDEAVRDSVSDSAWKPDPKRGSSWCPLSCPRVPSKHAGVISLFDTEFVLSGAFSKSRSFLATTLAKRVK